MAKVKIKPNKHVRKPSRAAGVGGGGGVYTKPKRETIKALWEGGTDYPVDPDARIAFNSGEVEIISKAKKQPKQKYIASKVKVNTPQEALEAYEGGKLKKAELPVIVFTFGMIDDPDNCTANQALTFIRKAVQNNIDIKDLEVAELEAHNTKFSKNKELLPLERKIKKISQYTQDAYTGNGSEKPGFNDSQIEDKSIERYEGKKLKYLVKPQKRSPVQPKSAVTETEDHTEVDHEGLKGVIASINATLENLDLDSLQDIRSAVSKTFNKEEWPKEEDQWS